MATTKTAADQEQGVFEAEWKQLTQIIERDRLQRVRTSERPASGTQLA